MKKKQFTETLLSLWRDYSTDMSVLEADAPVGTPILTFAGFISWLAKNTKKGGTE